MNKNILLLALGDAGASAIETFPSTINKDNVLFVNTGKWFLEPECPYRRLLIGEKCLKGLGTGKAIPLGKKAIDESFDTLFLIAKEYQHIIIVSGINGGTGGCAGYLAERLLAHKLQVGLSVIYPFPVENGGRKADITLSEIDKRKDQLSFFHVFRIDEASLANKRNWSWLEFIEWVDIKFMEKTMSLIPPIERVKPTLTLV